MRHGQSARLETSPTGERKRLGNRTAAPTNVLLRHNQVQWKWDFARNQDNGLLGATPIGFLFEPVTNPFTRIRLRLIAWNDMQMGMEHRLTSYRTAIPAHIVTLWIVFSINQRFDLRKE